MDTTQFFKNETLDKWNALMPSKQHLTLPFFSPNSFWMLTP